MKLGMLLAGEFSRGSPDTTPYFPEKSPRDFIDTALFSD